MRLLPYGDRALLVELDGLPEVLAWGSALAGLAGVEDVVPAARSVLVVATSPAVLPALREAVAGLEVEPVEPSVGDLVEVPVRYDGPDLAEVAAATRLREDEVVARHTGTDWRVAFTGFAPGFGYLVGGDPRLVVPRRATPRTRVPAGSVGLAGGFSGVYPRASPGGWLLVGRTDAVLFDLERDPPALLRPGVRVRFRAVEG